MNLYLRTAVVLASLVPAAGCASGPAGAPDVEASQAYLAEGRALAERNLHGEAVDVFTKAVHANPDSPEAYFHRGCSYVRMRLGQEMQGDSRAAEDKALRDFDAAIRLNPAYGKAYFNRAMILASRASYRAAAEDLNNACQYEARNPEPFLQLGRIYEEKFEGMGIAALERYDKYAELGGRDAATLDKVRAWRELKKQAAVPPGAAPAKPPAADDEKKAAELHDEFKRLFRENRKPEALKVVETLLSTYGHTAYVRERSREFGALLNALKK
jgi:tetratricopeptide (TPR) repeat protein